MTFEIVPAHEVAFSEQATIFNRAFEGYLAGWHDMDAAAAARFLSTQGIDLCYSCFARTNGMLAGFGFINRTGDISRLAGMGTVPEARRTGASAFILSHLLEDAKQRGDRAMVLEVFEQNVPAVTLYRRYGFRELMRLHGWRRPPSNLDGELSGEPEEISLLAANAMMNGTPDFPDIPWQVSRHIVPKLQNAFAYKIDNACVVVGDPAVSPTRIHAIFGSDSDAKNLLAHVLTKFPHAEFFAPAIFPESFGENIFRPLGFECERLNQFLMRRDLQ